MDRRTQIVETNQKEVLVSVAKRYIPERVTYWADIIGVTYGRISIRQQKTRWGSCSGEGNLNFNCLMMQMPKEIIDYVIVHELCHRKQMNHSKLFWAEVGNILPDYKERRKVLRAYRITEMAGNIILKKHGI